MKKVFIALFVCSVALVSCSELNQNGNSDNFYSNEVDTFYSSTDRTKIDGISRDIYYKMENNSFDGKLVKLVGLHISLFKKDHSLMLRTMDKDNVSVALHFDNKDELQDLFSKVDTLKVGEELNERKKTTHYIISKEEKRIVIQQWRNPIGGMSDRVKLSLSEYTGIKDAYNKYLSEQ
jgi:hypothetical protein